LRGQWCARLVAQAHARNHGPPTFVVGRDAGHSAQGFWLKALLRSLVGFSMPALIGNFFEPLAHLQIHIG